MHFEFTNLNQYEQRLVESLGINPLYLDLYNLALDDNGWLSAFVDKKHITHNELGPIPMAEAMRYMGVSGKLSIQNRFSKKNAISAITRCCRIARAIDLNRSSKDETFVVKSKIVDLSGDICRVSARLEDLDGTLILFAYLEFHLTFSSQPVDFQQILEKGSTKLFEKTSPYRAELENKSHLFDHECVTDIRLTNDSAAGSTNLIKGGVSEVYFYKRRYYPSAFIAAGIVTLASRLAAGRSGKRFYSFSVKYIKMDYLVLADMNQTLDLSCKYLEKAADVDVIEGNIMVGDKIIFQSEIGLVTY